MALYEKGSAAIDYTTLCFTVAAWVASPLVGALVAGGLSLTIERRIFSRHSITPPCPLSLFLLSRRLGSLRGCRSCGWRCGGWWIPCCWAGHTLAVTRTVLRCVANRPNPAVAAHELRPVLVGGTVGLIAAFLCSKGPTWLRCPPLSSTTAASGGG